MHGPACSLYYCHANTRPRRSRKNQVAKALASSLHHPTNLTVVHVGTKHARQRTRTKTRGFSNKRNKTKPILAPKQRCQCGDSSGCLAAINPPSRFDEVSCGAPTDSFLPSPASSQQTRLLLYGGWLRGRRSVSLCRFGRDVRGNGRGLSQLDHIAHALETKTGSPFAARAAPRGRPGRQNGLMLTPTRKEKRHMLPYPRVIPESQAKTRTESYLTPTRQSHTPPTPSEKTPFPDPQPARRANCTHL